MSPGGVERQHTPVSSILPLLLFKAKKESPKPKFQETPGNQEGEDCLSLGRLRVLGATCLSLEAWSKAPGVPKTGILISGPYF